MFRRIQKNTLLKGATALAVLATLSLSSCGEDEEVMGNNEDKNQPSAADFTNLLTNQINEVIIPTMVTYQSKMSNFVSAVNGLAASVDAANLTATRNAYKEAYLAYQAVAVHNYYATANAGLIENTNLYPVDTVLLSSLIANKTYNFNTTAQIRANGFPALDFMLYGATNGVGYFNADNNRIAFLSALVNNIKSISDNLVTQWNGNLKTNFVSNGGTALGSSISVQLNESIVYYEDHIRENKVGIPIGRLGPNDSPIAADATKIEGYYQSLAEGTENFTFELLKAGVEEIEDFYLGETTLNVDETGYDDMLKIRNQSAVDTEIKNQFKSIYAEIDSRTSISGNDELYKKVQQLVTLYKSDLLPLLNVQDADGANDGD
tara:strand:+ start:82023 stop:83153 length:1131 start_codon:yes stop_codon:yes gene_type:complete